MPASLRIPDPDGWIWMMSEQEAERLARLYQKAEQEIERAILRAISRGNDTRYLEGVKRNIQAILKDLQEGSRTWCEQAIPRLYAAGAKAAEAGLADKGMNLVTGFGAVHQQAAQLLAEASYNRLVEVTATIGRRVDDIYRQLSLEAVRGSVIGYDTWRTAARRLRDDLAEQGITGFADRAGRRWNMRTYAEMVGRTVTAEAHRMGTANRILEHGIDLVRITGHEGPCEMCGPWEGRILSLTGRTEGYPTLEYAQSRGLYHPNCRHAMVAHVDLTT